MTEYIVGLRLGKRSEVLTIEAEDALIAALKAKYNHPEALISYVRKSNRRGSSQSASEGMKITKRADQCPLVMLWTAPPPARECQRVGAV
jgi:hypothetical protein